MKKPILSLCSLALLLFVTPTFAQEHGGGTASEKAEGKKEEVKEVPKSNSQQEVLDLQAKLQALKTKISGKRDTLKKLIAEKEAVHDEKNALRIVNEMKMEYKDLMASTKEYEEQRSLLFYRYPEKGRSQDRQYERIEIKTLEDLESEFSVEGKVKKVVGKIRQQYPAKGSQSRKTLPPPVVDTPPVESDTSRGAVTESQVLSK